VKKISCVNDLISDIEAQIRDLQSRKKDLIEEMKEKERVGLGESGFYDRDIYDGGGNKYDGYVTSIAANDEVDVSNDTMM
jgi:splicing factor 3B subunit 1